MWGPGWIPSGKNDPADHVGFWPSSVKIPPAAHRFTPPDFPIKMFNRLSDYVIVDPALKSMLEAKKFGKVHFDTSAFEPISKDLSTNPLATMDVTLRSSLLDAFLTDTLLSDLTKLSKFAKTETDVTQTKSTLDLMSRLIRLTASSHFRLLQSSMTAFVSNRAALRDFVLKDFSVQLCTLEILRGSDFKSSSLFGPLPASFRASLQSAHGNALRCKPKRKSNFPSYVTSRSTFAAPVKRPYSSTASAPAPATGSAAQSFRSSAPQSSQASARGSLGVTTRPSGPVSDDPGSSLRVSFNSSSLFLLLLGLHPRFPTSQSSGPCFLLSCRGASSGRSLLLSPFSFHGFSL